MHHIHIPKTRRYLHGTNSPSKSFCGIQSTSLVLLPRLLGATPENLKERKENHKGKSKSWYSLFNRKRERRWIYLLRLLLVLSFISKLQYCSNVARWWDISTMRVTEIIQILLNLSTMLDVEFGKSRSKW